MNVTMKTTQEYYFIVVEKNPEGIIKNENLLKISRGFFFSWQAVDETQKNVLQEEREELRCAEVKPAVNFINWTAEKSLLSSLTAH